MEFQFATATRIVFGPGTLVEAAEFADRSGCRFMVVTGSSGLRAESLLAELNKRAVAHSTYNIGGEPTVDMIRTALSAAQKDRCTGVIGIGGGSALDAAKAVAALLTNPGGINRYLEVVGEARPLTEMPAPCIAVPTTAGTGAEVTRNAVIGVPEHGVKVSMRSPHMLPDLAVVDPELTLSMPAHVTASTGMDAFTQLVEPYVSPAASPITDAICREGLLRIACSLERACENGTDRQAREDMALAGLFGGLALANASVGAVHGIAGPLGGMIAAPHGMICARLLPFVVEVNLRALEERKPKAPALERYGDIARILTGSMAATPADGLHWIRQLCCRLAIPPLSALGLTGEMLSDLAEKSKHASSMKGNPISLTDAELLEILENAL